MDNNTFKDIVDKGRARQDLLLLMKGADYANNTDRLINFKQVGDMLGVDQTVVAGVYFLKHVTAICRAVRDRKLSSEPLLARFDDATNYLMLLLACFDETNPNLVTLKSPPSDDTAKQHVKPYSTSGPASYADMPVYVKADAIITASENR